MDAGSMLRPAPCEKGASVSRDGDRTLTRWPWLIEFMGGVTNEISNSEITNKKLINRMLSKLLTQALLSGDPNLQ